MATYRQSEEFKDAQFADSDLTGTRFVGCDLSGVVMRGVQIEAADIDAPWLFEGDSFFRVNGVDVIPYVDAELNRRFPGRELRDGRRPGRAGRCLGRSPGGLVGHPRPRSRHARRHRRRLGGRRVVVRADPAPPRPGHRHVAGQGDPRARPAYHPLGLRDASTEGEEVDRSVFATEIPTYDEVLAARADRVAMVRDFIAGVTAEGLAAPRRNPHDPELLRDHARLSPRDPRRGVGPPPLRRPRPRLDRSPGLLAPRHRGRSRWLDNVRPMPIKLENVGIAVRDLEETISFFTDLGLTVLGRDTVQWRVGRHRGRPRRQPRQDRHAPDASTATRPPRSSSSTSTRRDRDGADPAQRHRHAPRRLLGRRPRPSRRRSPHGMGATRCAAWRPTRTCTSSGYLRGPSGILAMLAEELKKTLTPGRSRRTPPGQSPGASGPVEIWRSVEITVTSGQCFACSSANSC